MSSRVQCVFCGAPVPPAETCVRCRASLTDRGSGKGAVWIVSLVLLIILLPTLTIAGIGLGVWILRGPGINNRPPQQAANNDDDDDDQPPPGWPGPIAIAPPPPDPLDLNPAPLRRERGPAKPVDLKIPPQPARLPINPTTLTQRTTYKLPETADRIVIAGGGRFLILHFPKLRKVGLFDINETKIVRYID